MTRVTLYAIAAILAAVLLAWGLWSFDPFGRRAKAEHQAVIAGQQTQVATAETHAVERVIRSEIVLQQQAMEAQDAVQKAQGSEAPLSSDVAASVRDSIERLRQPAGGGDAERAADAAGAVR